MVYSVIIIKENHKIPHLQHHSLSTSPSTPACRALQPTHQELNLSLAGGLGRDFHYSDTENINYHQICHYLPIPPPHPHLAYLILSPSSQQNEKQWFAQWIVVLLEQKRGQLCMPAPSNQNKELGKVFLEAPQGIFIENPRKYYSTKLATKERQRGRGGERRRQKLSLGAGGD